MINDPNLFFFQGLSINIPLLLLLSSIFALLVVFFIFSNSINVNAQPAGIALTHPSDAKASDKDKLTENSNIFAPTHTPPNVEFLTKELKEGKNVIKVNITSEAGINNCKVKYNKPGGAKTVDCVNDAGTVYKALIDAYTPTQSIEIYVRDIYGDSANSIKELKVVPGTSVLNLIWSSLSRLL
jgi:hypothetical protein